MTTRENAGLDAAQPEDLAAAAQDGLALSPVSADLEAAIDAAIDSAAETGAADEGPSPTRSLLARKILDIVVLPTTRISANERALAADLLLHLLTELGAEMRTEIALRASRVMECPPALLRMLMLDEIAVATKVLRGAESLPDALLIECAQTTTAEHRLLIARRLDMTPAVADALIHFSDEADLLDTLLRREEFALSPAAIEALVCRSATNPDLAGLLLRRRELEPAHAFMMFWWAGSDMRRRLIARFAIDRSVIQESVRDLYPLVFGEMAGKPDAFVTTMLTMVDRRHRPRGIDGEAISMDVVQRTLAAARHHPSREMAEAIGMIAGITRDLAWRILNDQTGEAYTVMCKSLGVPRTEFYEFLQPEDGSGDPVLTAQDADRLLEVYDIMARDYARAILRYWDWNDNPRIAGMMRELARLTEVPGI